MDLGLSGFRRVRQVLSAVHLTQVAELFGVGDCPGTRLSQGSLEGIAELLQPTGPIGAIAGSLIGPSAKPVRALLLDKSEQANWRLSWHQDRAIAVIARRDVEGFGPWTIKAGQPHVQPPTHILERMVTLRIHVDPVDAANAPLEVLPGSHRLGRLSERDIEALATTTEPQICLADAGDVWAYATLIVHASAEQKRAGRRRVLQIDYSADPLPGGLQWAPLLAVA